MTFFLSARHKGRRLTAILLLALVAAACHGRCFGQVDSDGFGRAILASGGKSDWKIVLPPGSSMPESLAAEELARYVRLISQAELDIVDEASAGRHAIRIESGSGALDGFDLVVASDQITIRGHTPRGALYGVYQLLEEMGCRWFYIGKLGEVVPEAADIALLCKETTQRASFRERSVMPAYPSYYERFDEWIDYLAKLRINNVAIYGQSLDWWKSNRARYLPLLQKRGMILEFGGHILPSFVPRDLFEEHPEYFRMNDKGERTKDKNFCPNSGAVAILKKNVRAHFVELPEITYFHAWADDLMGGGWCSCPKCKELPPADQNLISMNAVAGVLDAVNPDASLALLAYHDTGDAPGLEPAPNLFLFHAPRERCYRHGFDDPACRRNREEYMERWRDLRAMFQKTAPATIHEFNYYTDGLLDREMQPPQVETIPADARYFHSVGVPVHQNLMVCFRDWHSPPFSLVLSSRAAWSADVNGWEVLEDFCHHYYGERLAETMTGYYRKVEEACQLVFNGDPIAGPYIDMTWPPMDPVMRRAKIADVLQAAKIHRPLLDDLDKALKETPVGMTSERLGRERDVCELHQFILELACCHFEGQLLALQYLGGTVGREDGQRAKVLLADGITRVEKIGDWAARYPKEQGSLVQGWQSYWRSYTKIFAALEEKVGNKLSREK